MLIVSMLNIVLVNIDYSQGLPGVALLARQPWPGCRPAELGIR
jgi:hypothetical protein